MKTTKLARTVAITRTVRIAGLSLLLAGATLFAQQAEPQQAPTPYPQPYPTQQPYNQTPQAQPQQMPQQPYGGYSVAPPTGDLTLPAGTVVSVRINRPLSTKYDQQGDGFTAALQQPLVAGGYVVAQHGQNVLGRVTLSEKAGRVSGTSKLAVELAELTLADGQQVPIKTELVRQNGGTSIGRDVGAIGATTGLGAAIGAGVNGGVGAGVGAAGGLVVGLAGVLLTRGHDTVIYPETLLVFRLTAPVTVNTSHSAQAFLPVSPQDYQNGNQPVYSSYRAAPGSYGGGYAYAAPYPYYSPYYAYWGPGFWYGPGFYFRGGYGFRGGFRGGRR